MSYQLAREPTQPLALGISRPGNLAEAGARLVYHLHIP